MPLRDHFQRPVSGLASWGGMLAGWPMVIVQQLRRVLPTRYISAPRVHLKSELEFEVDASEVVAGETSRGGEFDELLA